MKFVEAEAGEAAKYPFAPGNDKIRPHLVPTPRCPDLKEITSVDELLPYFDSVARRPYSPGLWPAWDLKKGERVLLLSLIHI